MQAAPTQWSGNGHYYEFIAGPVEFASARDAALASTFNGATGYLATITSQAENDFIASLGSIEAFIGASDADQEGIFKWLDGPEAGDVLTYSNWNPGEPNDDGGNEDYVHFNFLSSGGWNDIFPSYTQGYIVEYSPTPIPLPAGLPLLAVGLCVLGVMRRRKS